jgi:sterol desaturase/sphingolipid hydroxylase (fatty acid hydroxylase superfamily)
LKHHKNILYFTPLSLKVRGAVPVLLVLMLLVSSLFGLFAGLGCVTAVAIGWSTYEVLHQSIHVNGPRGPYTRWAARYHLSHHFGHSRSNFGVTTPLWDLVFRTYSPISRVRVPRRSLASVPWLASVVDTGAPSTMAGSDYDLS